LLIDVHCHLDLYGNPGEIVARAKKVGVSKIVSVSMEFNSMTKNLELANSFRNIVKPALGVHPAEVESLPHNELKKAIEFLRENVGKAVAIGEVGLDHYFSKSKDTWRRQEEVFRVMLEVAIDAKLPVIVHSLRAEKDVFHILREYEELQVIIHWYTGPASLVKEGIRRGYFFSITPAISYSAKVRRVVKQVELDHILSESDGPVKYRGVEGEPANCKLVIEKIAEIKNLSVSTVEDSLFENAKQLFKL